MENERLKSIEDILAKKRREKEEEKNRLREERLEEIRRKNEEIAKKAEQRREERIKEIRENRENIPSGVLGDIVRTGIVRQQREERNIISDLMNGMIGEVERREERKIIDDVMSGIVGEVEKRYTDNWEEKFSDSIVPEKPKIVEPEEEEISFRRKKKPIQEELKEEPEEEEITFPRKKIEPEKKIKVGRGRPKGPSNISDDERYFNDELKNARQLKKEYKRQIEELKNQDGSEENVRQIEEFENLLGQVKNEIKQLNELILLEREKRKLQPIQEEEFDEIDEQTKLFEKTMNDYREGIAKKEAQIKNSRKQISEMNEAGLARDEFRYTVQDYKQIISDAREAINFMKEEMRVAEEEYAKMNPSYNFI